MGWYATMDVVLIIEDPGAMWGKASWASRNMAMMLVLKANSRRSRSISSKWLTCFPCKTELEQGVEYDDTCRIYFRRRLETVPSKFLLIVMLSLQKEDLGVGH